MPKSEEKVEMCALHNETFDTQREKEKHEEKYNCLTVRVTRSEVEWMRDVMMTSLAIRVGGI